jgi:succinyl-CoA synthetase alpha subunit
MTGFSGRVGVISRSGSQGTLVCLNLTQAGLGQSVFYGVGGDPIAGTSITEALRLLDNDGKTRAVVICGEIGGTAEEEAADYACNMKKPVVSFIARNRRPRKPARPRYQPTPSVSPSARKKWLPAHRQVWLL